MRLKEHVLSGDPALLAAELRSLVPGGDSVSDRVSEIISQVRSHGDAALLDYTRLLDTGGAEPSALRVETAVLARAAAQLERPVQAALRALASNLTRVGRSAAPSEDEVEFGTHRVTIRSAPVASAAVYVPGGRAPYPSTVMMGVVSAGVAGVGRVVVCAPPSRDGDVDPIVLAACRLAGAQAVYRMGGAQAIAALAYGTESVEPVDMIVGPGNLYVQEAKRQASAVVGIDGFAGPTDLVLIASGDANPEMLALDLLAQAEHGEGTLVVAVSDSPALLGALAELIGRAVETGAVAVLVEVGEMREALALAQALAPEHLQLVGSDAEPLAAGATRAGCVFVGPASGTAFGDYIAGSNHVLPTGGAARFASALSPHLHGGSDRAPSRLGFGCGSPRTGGGL
jgi:histidinol dehydrogenase